MLHFDINPLAKHRFTLFRMLLRDERTQKLLKPIVEDNVIAAIYGLLSFHTDLSCYML